MNKFAERFKEILETKNISQREFARRYGFAQKTVNNWCLGKREPNLDIIVMICKEFHEDANYLLGLKDE